VNYLCQIFEAEKPPTVSILYNCNSSYSCSFRNSIRQYLANHKIFNLLSEDRECGYLNEDYQKIRTYLDNHRQVQIIIVIPDERYSVFHC
jgi:hypothetical protein